MPFSVWDFRTDIANVVVTPEIRCRFLRMEPGQVATRHSHDLGHEVFLILQGQCEFEIDGDHALLGPGQMCFAYAHQMHQVRVIGDEPMVMYLSVTPHIEPTHTLYDPDTGRRLPPRYNPPAAFDRTDYDATTPTADLVDRQVAAARALAETAAAAAEAQAARGEALKAAAAAGDRAAMAAAMDDLWAGVYATLRAVGTMSTIWNDLAPRAADRGE